MKTRLTQFWGKYKYCMKFKTKLMVSYFILIIIPLGLFTWLSYVRIAQSTEMQTQYSADQVIRQAADMLNYKIDNIVYVSDQVFFNTSLNSTLKRDENLPIGPDLLVDYQNLRTLISNAFKKNDMYKLTLYLKSSIYYSNEESGLSANVSAAFSNISNISNSSWYKSLQGFTGKVLWLAPLASPQANNTTVNVISGVRFIKDMDNYKSNLCILRIDLLQSDLNNITKKVSPTANGVAFIINSDNVIIASSNDKLAYSYKDNITSHMIDSDGWKFVTVGKDLALVGVIDINNTDWKLISIIPNKDIVSVSKQTRNEMLLLMAIIGSLAYLLAYLFSGSVTKRVSRLTSRMKNIKHGNIPSVMEEAGTDEISVLVESYNFMIEEMKRFSAVQYKLGQDVKNAELKALQAQINPHFLYNTLELINWIALKNDVPEIAVIARNLAKFYKLSLSKGKDTIPIEDEISHVETYVKLQNFRFKNNISLILNIDQDLLHYCIMKLILQPIVENSILHGILEKKEKTGTIIINGTLKDNYVLFTIEDDGIGMDEDSIVKLLSNDVPKDFQGYGIANVNERIKLHYGNECGLSFKSVLGQGTSVMVKILAVSTANS